MGVNADLIIFTFLAALDTSYPITLSLQALVVSWACFFTVAEDVLKGNNYYWQINI